MALGHSMRLSENKNEVLSEAIWKRNLTSALVLLFVQEKRATRWLCFPTPFSSELSKG
jgi:hypothetical protein